MIFFCFDRTGFDKLYPSFLKDKYKKLVVIVATPPIIKEKKVTITYYENGVVYDEQVVTVSNKNYFKYLIFLRLVLNNISCAYNAKVALVVGYLPFAIFLSSKLRRIKKLIYRPTDFYPKIVNGKICFINIIAGILDFSSMFFADEIILTTLRQKKARLFFRFVNKENHIIPLSCYSYDLSNLTNKTFEVINLLYIGLVSDYHCLDKIITALKDFKDNVALNIVGDGPAKTKLMKIAHDNGLSNVKFFGFVPDEELPNIAKDCHYGLCVYKETKDFMYFTEPAKAKLYISLGLPVLISSEPELSSELAKAGLGILTSIDEIKLHIQTLLTNRELYTKKYTNDLFSKFINANNFHNLNNKVKWEAE